MQYNWIMRLLRGTEVKQEPSCGTQDGESLRGLLLSIWRGMNHVKYNAHLCERQVLAYVGYITALML